MADGAQGKSEILKAESRKQKLWVGSDFAKASAATRGREPKGQKEKAEIGKRQFVSFVSWLFKTRAHPQAVSRLRLAPAVQGSAWGGCRRVGGHAPQSQRTPPHGR